MNRTLRKIKRCFDGLATDRGLHSHYVMHEESLDVESNDAFLHYQLFCSETKVPDELREQDHCFHITLFRSTMIVKRLHVPSAMTTKGRICGRDILTRLYFLARDLHLRTIRLADASKLILDVNGRKYHVKLFMYYNLLRGQSWYNKFGYYSTDHEDQHRDVAKLRNTALDEYCRSANREDNLSKILQIDASTPIAAVTERINTEMLENSAILGSVLDCYEELDFEGHIGYDQQSMLTLNVLDKNTADIYGYVKTSNKRKEARLLE